MENLQLMSRELTCFGRYCIVFDTYGYYTSGIFLFERQCYKVIYTQRERERERESACVRAPLVT